MRGRDSVVSEFNPTFEQNLRYFSYRLPLERLTKHDQQNVRCPFHGDQRASMSVSLAKGVWNCKGCNLSGGILEFEKRMMQSTADQAWAQIYRIMGMDPPRRDRRLVTTYQYCDEAGRVKYEKLRYEPKDFAQRQPDGKNGWVYNLHGVKKILYRLPDLVVARLVFVVEGEKDAENLREALELAAVKDAAVTTTFDGAGHWKPEYAPYFTGRLVVVLRDNDAKGLQHQQTICASVQPFAKSVKAVELPGLVSEHEDVSDWLDRVRDQFETGSEAWKKATVARVGELTALVKKTPAWEAEDKDHVLLEEMTDFLGRAPAEIDWLVDGILPAKTRGLMVADGKVGKSPLALDLALALASGSSWLGHVVKQRRRVAVVSREDAPEETSRRLKLLQAGSAPRAEYAWGQIWLNTSAQSAAFLLDHLEHVDALIAELKLEQFDLVIFDVLRDLHSGDENDNTVMSAIMQALKRFQVEAGCAVLLLHHISKAQSANIFRDARGAGAIHGWTEYGVGLSVTDETQPRRDWVRKVEFELKYACPADPVYFKITGDDAALRIELTDAPEPVQAPAPRRRKVQDILDGRSNRKPLAMPDRARAYERADDNE